VGLILFARGSVLAQEVTYNSAPGTDFSKFKTYKWVKVEAAEYPNQILDQQIKQSIDSQLATKRFVQRGDGHCVENGCFSPTGLP